MTEYRPATHFLPASKVKPGDVANYCGETFAVASAALDATSGLIRFGVHGGMPQFVAPDREVKVERMEVYKPYVVLTRRYLKDGTCKKGRHTFATKGEQSRFMDRTTAAVTFYTT